MKKTFEQILSETMAKGIIPGASVKWTTVIGTTRYGCVLEILSEKPGIVLVQASNARLMLRAEALTPSPETQDAITADLEETYGPLHSWTRHVV